VEVVTAAPNVLAAATIEISDPRIFIVQRLLS
jgi:hypothetical protein